MERCRRTVGETEREARGTLRYRPDFAAEPELDSRVGCQVVEPRRQPQAGRRCRLITVVRGLRQRLGGSTDRPNEACRRPGLREHPGGRPRRPLPCLPARRPQLRRQASWAGSHFVHRPLSVPGAGALPGGVTGQPADANRGRTMDFIPLLEQGQAGAERLCRRSGRPGSQSTCRCHRRARRRWPPVRVVLHARSPLDNRAPTMVLPARQP